MHPRPSSLPRPFGTLLDMMEEQRRRTAALERDREILRQFVELDDSLLADLGLSREDLDRIALACGVRL